MFHLKGYTTVKGIVIDEVVLHVLNISWNIELFHASLVRFVEFDQVHTKVKVVHTPKACNPTRVHEMALSIQRS